MTRNEHEMPLGAAVSFVAMEHGTADDYRLLESYEAQYAAALPNRLLEALGRLEHSLAGYQVTRLEHSLQAATRARNDGAHDDWVAAALIHDLGDELAPYNHGEIAAAILEPYVAPNVTWVIRHHGAFQNIYYAHHLGGDPNARDQFAGHPSFDECVAFCARWDQNSFNPNSPIDPLESFEPLLREVFNRDAWSDGRALHTPIPDPQ